MYASAAGVCEKFGLGPLRMLISDEVSGDVTTQTYAQSPDFGGGFRFGELRPNLFFEYDAEAGGIQTTPAGDIDLLAVVLNPNIEDPTLTYSWTGSIGGKGSRGMNVTVNSGTTNTRQWSDLTFSVEPDGSGEEFGEMDYLIEVVITTTINGRSQSVRFGTFRANIAVQFG